MYAEGMLVKMPVRLAEEGTVHYTLRLEQPRPGVGVAPAEVTEVSLNRFVGRAIRLTYTGELNCIRCGRRVDKHFGEGYCYPCFRDAPEAAECIVRPELCEAHLGRGRDPEWELEHHNQPHAVYLAVSSAIKVGVTRLTQIPTRWIDQGAAAGAQIAEVPYRRLAGRIEVALKKRYTDRTAWQRMLKGERLTEIDFGTELAAIRELISGLDDGDELRRYLYEPRRVRPLAISYPLPTPPNKVKAVSLRKSAGIESTLLGVRGQYLVFDGGAVLNVRRHSGVHVSFEA
jgi:hypothetical protein